MGTRNNIMCGYLEKPDKFADFINGSLHNGNQILLPGQITDCQTVYSKNGKTRDILKAVYNGTNYLLIGIENQNLVHYAMPIRCMEYDVLEYKKQLQQLKSNRYKMYKAKEISMSKAEFLSGMKVEDKMIPVTTIVFYHGNEDYDGCRNLHDMLSFTKENEQRPQEIDEDTRTAINGLTQVSDFLGKRAIDKEAEEVDKCNNALKEWETDLRREGMELGIEALILDYLEDGFTEDRIVEKLRKIFKLTKKSAKEYVAKFSAK